MPREISVSIQTSLVQIDERALVLMFHQLDKDKRYKVDAGELSVVFVDNKGIAKLHQEFMNDPTDTDVITFHGDPAMDFAGEICVSVEKAKEMAHRIGHSFIEEVSLYLVHGWLHLAGLKDKSDEDALAMREGEQYLMAYVKATCGFPLLDYSE